MGNIVDHPIALICYTLGSSQLLAPTSLQYTLIDTFRVHLATLP